MSLSLSSDPYFLMATLHLFGPTQVTKDNHFLGSALGSRIS